MYSKVRHTEFGFTLIEVLLAAFALSISLLGFLQSELTALRMTQVMHSLNQAYIKSMTIAEKFKACAGQFSCVTEQKAQWCAELKKSLPEAECILNSIDRDYQLKINKLTSKRFKWPTVYSLRFSV